MTSFLTRPLEEAEFAALDPATWNGLLYGMRRPSVFCTYEWLSTWWKHFRRSYGFYFLSVWQDGRLVGALPLVRCVLRIEDAILPARTILLAGSREVAPDHVDIMVAADYGEAVAREILRYLHDRKAEWDLLHFSHIDADGLLGTFLATYLPGLQMDTLQSSTAPYLELRGNFDDYMHGNFRGKKRRQMDAWHKKVCEEGMQFSECESGQESVVVDALFRLHGQRANVKGITSFFQSEDLRRFHVELAERLNRSGFLNTIYVERGGEILGVLYCFRVGSKVFWYQVGVDPEYAKMSLGTVMLYELIRTSFEKGIAELDFLRGPGPHKSRWTKESRPLVTTNVYSNTTAGVLQKLTCRARRRLVRIVKDIASRRDSALAEDRAATDG